MFVYIMTNKPDGTLYFGVTNNLVRRVHEHRLHAAPDFTNRYTLERLVWFGQHDTPTPAIRREKTLKIWLRAWKNALVEQMNATGRDLWGKTAGSSPTTTTPKGSTP